MKSYHINAGAGINALTIKEHDIKEPGFNEVLVKVKATSLNYRELMIIEDGKYPLPVKPDVVPVADGAGEVVAVGNGVTRFKTGDRVTGIVFPEWVDGPFLWEYSQQLGGSLDGMLAEYVLMPEHWLLHIPQHLSWEEAATLPCAGVTAWNALNGARPVLPGENVLALGSGGVSLFAMQLAKLSGARVIATTSSDEKAEKLRALGADEVINYNTTPDWHLAVKQLTGGHGADHIIEVGGPGTMERSMQSLSVGGEISMIGWLAGGSSTIDLNAFNGTVGNLRRIALGSRAHHIAMNRAIQVNGLKPVIDKVFHFNEAKEALHYLAAGRYFGKVVIVH
ncbi:MAG TPA: NAD(P)-dependent alcohol dehydrogenase [Chitinophaga sp.]|uniref:zinc-dependent alcohol dehydrogenase family protein n=1 Tax=Chitinophaga sp. TaxID=1869181 RepID=UPI002C1937BC|nr:NAD(P)-dependent alcohol dehydrogenase [Chitinophaga sp.]HVI49512.1 NAD(P)-dependent alcohol dehydrogenase [Chitinophaga sp.]